MKHLILMASLLLSPYLVLLIPDVQATTVLSIEPRLVSGLLPPQVFTVRLMVSNVNDLDGWEAEIVFTPGVLKVLGESYPAQGESVFCVDPGTPGCYNLPRNSTDFDNALGTAHMGATFNPYLPDSGPSGSGTLATITFEVLCAECSSPVDFAPVDASTRDDPTKLRSAQGGVLVNITHERAPGFFTNKTLNPPIASFRVIAGMGAGVGFPITFDASSSRDPDGQIVLYEWDFGDGTIASVATPVTIHAFPSSGTFTVGLRLTDDDGLASEQASQYFTAIDIPAPNPAPPVAVFFINKQGAMIGEPVVFDGSLSLDIDGTIVSYTWNLGDGSSTLTQANALTEHAYSTEGTFTATLTVTDDDGLSGSTSNTVFVNEPLATVTSPTAVLSVEPRLITGFTPPQTFVANLTVTDVTDLDGWEAKLVFDPGKLTIVDARYPDPGESPFCGTDCYNFPAPIQIDNGAGTVSGGATNIPIPPTGPSGTGSLLIMTFQVLCNDCSDIIGFAPLESNGDDPTKLRSVQGGIIVPISHTKVVSTFTNRVLNAPTASFTVTSQTMPPKVGDNVTFDASASYDPDGMVVQYNWDFGDGTKFNETNPFTVHVFQAEAVYTTSLIVVDNDNLASEPFYIYIVVLPQPPSTPYPPYPSFFSSKPRAALDELVVFDASASYDPDGTVVSYGWDFGDGTVPVTETDSVTEHIYNTGGTFIVTLTVTDDDGYTSTLSHPQTILLDHDVAIYDVYAYSSHVFAGSTLTIAVSFRNLGLETETVDITTYYDSNVAASRPGILIGSGDFGYELLQWDTTGVPLGTYAISAEIFLSTDENPANNFRTDGQVTILPPPTLDVSPVQGGIGTKVTVHGSDFETFGYGPRVVLVSFDDMFMGFTLLEAGDTEFTFVFSIPHAEPGPHQIKALDTNTGVRVAIGFQVLDDEAGVTGNFDVTVSVGAIYFPNDKAEIFVMTSLDGHPGPETVQLEITLVRPDGTRETLQAQRISTGLFKASYDVPRTASIGTYAVVAAASNVDFYGSSLATFEVKQSWINAQGPRLATATATVAGIGAVVALAWRKGYLRRKGEEPALF